MVNTSKLQGYLKKGPSVLIVLILYDMGFFLCSNLFTSFHTNAHMHRLTQIVVSMDHGTKIKISTNPNINRYIYASEISFL